MSNKGFQRNICVVTSWFPSKIYPGRAPFVYNFVKNLAKSGVKVSVIVPQLKGDKPFSEDDSVTIYRIRGAFPLFSMLNLVKKIDPDIIHVHAPNFFASVTIIVAKITHIPIIATVHRAEVDSISNAMFFFRKYAIKKFRRIIAVSEFTKSLAIKAGADANKISVIYNSCDEALFSSKSKEEARKIHDLQRDKKIILFVGNLIKLKGVYVLIHALKILYNHFPNFHILFIGQGEERKNMELLIKEYGLTENVRFLGLLPQAKLSDYYNASNIFVLPSLTEGHSVALLEAMASGLPVVASSVGGNKESVDDGVNGFLFESGDANILAQKIATILSDSKLEEKMSATSSMIYRKKFSTKTQMENYLKLYDSLLDETHLPSNNSTVLLIDNQGLSHYTSYLACGLSKKNNVVFCGFSRDDYIVTGASDKKIKFHCIGEKLPKGNSVMLVIFRPLFLLFSLSKLLTRIKYDIVHIQGHLPSFFLFLPMLKLRGKQICWTLHDVNLRPSSAGMRGKLELLFTRIVTQTNILGKYVDAIIVHGSALKNDLISKGVNKNKIHVIPHFDYRYLLNSSHKKEHDTGSPFEYVLVFGRIKPYKGIDVLINAVKIVRQKIGKNFNVLIAGKGDTSYFKNLIKSEDLEYIHIRNEFIPTSQIHDIFLNAKFVVLPYVSASQSGIIPLTYTFSKPVVVSNVGSIGEYVEHGKTGYIFESGNVDQLANYIIELFEDNDMCKTMGINANQKLLQEMSLEKCCEIINDIYKRH